MTYDPRIPAREICVLGYQIEHWALKKPGAIAIMFYGGEIWTWRQTLELTQRTAKAQACRRPRRACRKMNQHFPTRFTHSFAKGKGFCKFLIFLCGKPFA